MTQYARHSSARRPRQLAHTLHYANPRDSAQLERDRVHLHLPGALTVDEESGALVDLISIDDIMKVLDCIDTGVRH